MVLIAVKQNGHSLKYVHYDLRNDRELVLAAVKQTGYALRYDFKKDLEVVMEAVKQNGHALKYAHNDLRHLIRESMNFPSGEC